MCIEDQYGGPTLRMLSSKSDSTKGSHGCLSPLLQCSVPVRTLKSSLQRDYWKRTFDSQLEVLKCEADSCNSWYGSRLDLEFLCDSKATLERKALVDLRQPAGCEPFVAFKQSQFINVLNRLKWTHHRPTFEPNYLGTPLQTQSCMLQDIGTMFHQWINSDPDKAFISPRQLAKKRLSSLVRWSVVGRSSTETIDRRIKPESELSLPKFQIQCSVLESSKFRGQWVNKRIYSIPLF